MARWVGLDALDSAEDPLTYALREVHQPSPERRLAAAVLGEVVEDLRRGPGTALASQVAYRDVREWVRDDDTSWPYSFVPLCEALGLDVARTRDGLLAIRPYGRQVNVGLRAALTNNPRRISEYRVPTGRRASWWSGERVPRSARQGGRRGR